jgi:peptide/nickel transport system permease protein
VTRLRVGLALVGVLLLLALLAPVLAPYPPHVQLDLDALRNAAPSITHPLGTDPFSRDLLSRVLYGARVSLGIAVLAVLVAVVVGVTVGVVSGWIGGLVDTMLMRAVDAALAVPRLFTVLVVLALWEHVTVPAIVAILGGTGWFAMSRLVRAEVRGVRARPWIAAARAVGMPAGRIVLRHVLPNIAGPVIVVATMGIGQVILIEAGLSYLGLGVPQPMASWGSIIADGQPLLRVAPWVAGGAGLALVITVLAFTLVGDGLRERLDPRASRA